MTDSPADGIRSRDSAARASVSLDGQWTFAIDPDNVGVDETWFDPATALPEELTKRIAVPHAWQEHDEYRSYTGTGWYRRRIDLDDGDRNDGDCDVVGDADRLLLRFGAVDYEATVWVNGTAVGRHRGGYLPFEFEITDAVEPGENVVAVRVHDPADLAEIPHGKQGAPWYTRVSGIWQSVSIEGRGRAYVDRLRATPELDADAVSVEVRVAGRVADLDGTVVVTRDGEPVASAAMGIVDCEPVDVEGETGEPVDAENRDQIDAGGGIGRVTIPLDDPAYWTPDDPVLYDLAVRLVDDEGVVDVYEDTFGMRSVTTEDGRLYLNGEPFTIRGALDQAYYPETHYRPTDASIFEHEIRTAKELGFNLLRKHIKPAHPDFVELADRLGILVWQEPANPSVYTDRSREAVRTQLWGLIDRDYNSPSVIIWSCYNEEWGIGGHEDEESLWTDEEKQAYLAGLYERTTERDPTRLVCDNSGWAHVATDLNDYHRYFVSPDRSRAWAEDLDAIVENPAENYVTPTADDNGATTTDDNDATTTDDNGATTTEDGATTTDDDDATTDNVGPTMDPADAPIVVSEFGTWGFPDLDVLYDCYGGEPPWFSHDFLPDGLKRPEGVKARFAHSSVSSVFDGFDDLATTWQAREFVSIKDVIEQLRTREAIAGYVITEFSDIEWEFNGILDYCRGEKAFHDDFASVNGPLLVRIVPEQHVAWSDESVSVDLAVVNDCRDPIDADVEWEAFGRSRTVRVEAAGHGITVVEDAFAVSPSTVESVRTEEIRVSLSSDEEEMSNAEPITVVDRDYAALENAPTVSAPDRFATTLATYGISTTSEPSDADVVITVDPDDADALASAGAAVLLLPDEHGAFDGGAVFETRPLAERESWNLVASLFYQDDEHFAGFGDHRRLDWSLEDAYPHAVVDDPDPDDEILVGYVEGWLANHGSPLLVRDRGAGRICACTFRLSTAYGSHPAGTLLVNRLLRTLALDR